MSEGLIFNGQSLRVTLQNGIVQLCFDRQNSSNNRFDSATVDELAQVTRAILAAGDVRGLLLTSAKDSFAVGADIFEFPALFAGPAAGIEHFNAAQNRVFREFEDLPLPTVSAINGLALGGGFEVTLATDARVIASGAQVGLPEVTLGIFPGYGGTVRLPRIVGAKTALDWIVTGRMQRADSVRAAQLVDEVVELGALHATASALLQRLIGSEEWRARRSSRMGPVTRDADDECFTAARAQVRGRSPHEPAPLAAIELIQQCVPLSRDAAQAEETRAFASIATTPTARALVQTFINDQQVKKKAKSLAKSAAPVARCAVLGAGIMGGGIAYTSARQGVPILMKDIAQAALDLGMGEARRLVARQVETGRTSAVAAETLVGTITPTLSFDGFDAVDLVVEAIVENAAIKQDVLAEVEGKISPATILASNTSSLSIALLASRLARPENFVGMHFFNPVPVMPLVEVVRGPRTGDAAVAAVAGYAVKMGKTPIVVRDCPGFLVNRILTAQFVGFLMLLRDGADFAQIDAVMEAFGWPMGPAHLQDVIGMDTSLHVIEVITDGYRDRMHLGFRHAIAAMVAQERRGQKTGAGFYAWRPDAKGRPLKQEDPAARAVVTALQGDGTRNFADAEIIERMMLPLIVEAARALQEGIAETPAEIDMSLLLGIGFPRHLGGALKYADLLGVSAVVQACRLYSPLGGCYRPSAGLLEMARSDAKFYP
jgi:3-hydroxyacyl-CoA dehydrogenase/enoyl-CoA hydratase/3-hydroxybutyryl-CoA epimerase/enoyl-CoA isomerase